MEPALGESWEAVGASEDRADCVLPTEALAPRVPWPLCVDAAITVGACVPCALPVGTTDTVEKAVLCALPEACAVGVEAASPREDVGMGVRVCAAPEGDTRGDTVGVGKEEGEDAPVVCPDWDAVSVGFDGVGMDVKVAEEVDEAVEVAVGVGAVEGVGKEEPAAVPLEAAEVVGGAEGVGDRVSALDRVCGPEGEGREEGAAEVVGFEGVGGRLCPEVVEGAKEWEGWVEGELDTEGDPEGPFEADPATLSLPWGVGVLGEEAAAEGDTTLAEGEVEGKREGVDPRVSWAEAVLNAEAVKGADAMAETVGAVVREGASVRVTTTVPDGVDVRLTLGWGLKEADTEDDTERVAWDTVGRGLGLVEGDTPEDVLVFGEGEALAMGDRVGVDLGLTDTLLDGKREEDTRGVVVIRGDLETV